MMQDNLIEGFRLSTQQQRLWLLGQDSEAFCSLCTIILEGDLQADTLRQAVQRVIHRHEILRTTFCRRAGMKVPLQMVADNMIPFWQHFDLTELNASEQTAKVGHIFHQQTRLPFNFDQGPLLRLYLLTLSGQKHVLLVCLPALCADAVALSNLVHEISRAYDAVLSSQDMGEEPLQYVDFCAWQEEMLETEDEDAALGKEYWRKQNVSSAPALLFPCEDKRNTRTQFVPKSFSLVIGPDAIKRIDLIVRQYDTSVSEFFLACWQTVLWKLTGQSELLIACEFDGRTVEDLRTALGLFARSLPILCRIGKDCAFGEVLTRVTEATRAARKWQDYFEWETGVDAVDEPIRPNYFPVAFEFHEVLPTHDAPGLSFSIGKRHVCFEKFKLKLSCSYFDDSLTAEFQYDPNVFLADDVERLAGQFHTLLTRAVNDTEAPIGELEVLSHIEKQRLLVEWNDTKSDCSKEKCIHQLFEEQAVRAPANIAVVYDDQQLTYKQLNSRANQLAHYLRGIGVQPETQVALCVESVAMVPALLGVLKAGGAYVPLDPMLPKERLAFMLRDSQAAVLLTQQHLLENLPEYKGQVICLDAGWNLVAQQTQENPISGVTSKNLAYVLFTSGSTGNPKGVAVEHQQLLNYLHGILPRLDLPGGANFATFSTFAADLGNTAIFPSLCTGGCLHLISRERASDPNALADYFTRHLIDCVKIVPPHLEALLTSSRPERVLPRRRLVLGGEAASWDLIKRLQALATDCVILNHYGPTEATVGVTTYRVENGQSDSRSATVPIGRPIANTEIYLLDTQLRPVPIWVPGELYIGGANVSRGYLNHPELTAEKFIPDPFSAEPSARLYKTGDLARYQPDGNIEFLGRIDNQVKIRGFRIELGEIEAVLTQHPSVRQAVTVLREDVPGDKRLVACIVPNTERASTINDLRNFLKSKLPEYMVPAALVFIDELPLTPNGKVDRRALPGADHIRPDLEESFVAPRTPIEQALAEIWTEILKLEQFGVHDNFFDLGGHSLLATRVISRIRQEFQMDLPLRTLFENPTVADLAVQIAEVQQKRAVPEQLIEVLADLAVLSDEEAERQLEASKLQ